MSHVFFFSRICIVQPGGGGGAGRGFNGGGFWITVKY